jgi:hypothetical protein
MMSSQLSENIELCLDKVDKIIEQSSETLPCITLHWHRIQSQEKMMHD